VTAAAAAPEDTAVAYPGDSSSKRENNHLVMRALRRKKFPIHSNT